MKKTSSIQWSVGATRLLAMLLLALMMIFASKHFLLVSHAQSAGKITATSANIRQEANPNSTGVGSATKNTEVSIISQTTGTDGKIWYEVFVDATTTGYIRSDLLTITDGSTPPTKEAGAAGAPANEGAGTSNSGVAAVSPVSATVKGSDSVRVRADASTGSNIVTTASRGLAVTVTGTAQGTDGNTWYQVSFIADGAEVSGFIRSDYVELGGELAEAPAEEPGETSVEETPAETAPVEEKIEKNSFSAEEEAGIWYLCDNREGEGFRYKAEELVTLQKQYKDLYAKAQNKIKNQKIVIALVGIVAGVMLLIIIFLIYKLRDAKDSEYFHQVEQETIRRRTADRPKKVKREEGLEEEEPQPQRQRPQGQGQRPQGQRPQGQGQRPQGQGQRPQGQRPQGQGQRPQGQRPQGQGQRPQGQRPQGQRPQPQRGTAEEQPRTEGQRPVRRTQQVMPKPQEELEQTKVIPTQEVMEQEAQQNWKSKNFMEEDDEFEFEFLNNWDGNQ